MEASIETRMTLPSNPSPPPAAFALARELWEAELPDSELRSAQRFAASATLRITPLDDCLQPAEESFAVVLRDISEKGLSFIHTRAITNRFVLVEFATRESAAPRLLAHVVRCQPVRLFYLIAARIISKNPPIGLEAGGTAT